MKTQERTTSRSFYHRLTIAGVLIVAAGTAVYSAIAIPVGDPRAPLFVPATLASLGIAALLRRTTKALWIAAIGGPLLLAVFAIDSFRLLHPDSFIDFVPSVLAAIGAATATAASIAALVQTRHGTEHRPGTLDHALVATGVVVLVAISAYSGIATFARPRTAALSGGREAVIVTAHGNRWEPNTIAAARDDGLVLVRNPDWFAHTFVVPGLGVDTYLAPRSERIVEIDVRRAGGFRFQCDVTGHEKMVGTLVVP